jgi:Amt family ammonium transporter
MAPHSLTLTMVGAALLWVGWFGFNAGSSEASGLKTAQALAMTQIAAATGALTWIVIEGFFHRKATSLGLMSGILAGLVVITPAAGDVLPVGASALGVIASVICYFAVLAKSKFGYDDTLDVFGIHGVAGIVGGVGLTFFLRPMEGRVFSTQLFYQVEGIAVSIGYSAVVTLILLVLVEKTLGLRMTDKEQSVGMDHTLHGEAGYGLLNLN